MADPSRSPIILHLPAFFTFFDAAYTPSDIAYLEAYELVVVPQQRHYRSYAELCDEIKRQLYAKYWLPSMSPDMLHIFDMVVWRIRDTWIHKYDIAFDANPYIPWGMPPPNARNHILQPFNMTYIKNNNVINNNHGSRPVNGTQNDVAVHMMNNFPQPHPQPLQEPPAFFGRPAPSPPARPAPNIAIYMMNAFPQPHPQPFQEVPAFVARPAPSPPRSEFNFSPPPRRGSQHRRKRGGSRYCLDDGELPWFRRFETLDRMHLHDHRAKAKRIQDLLPATSVPRCYEALWRHEYNVEEAVEWLSQLPQGPRALARDLADDNMHNDGGGGYQRLSDFYLHLPRFPREGTNLHLADGEVHPQPVGMKRKRDIDRPPQESGARTYGLDYGDDHPKPARKKQKTRAIEVIDLTKDKATEVVDSTMDDEVECEPKKTNPFAAWSSKSNKLQLLAQVDEVEEGEIVEFK